MQAPPAEVPPRAWPAASLPGAHSPQRVSDRRLEVLSGAVAAEAASALHRILKGWKAAACLLPVVLRSRPRFPPSSAELLSNRVCVRVVWGREDGQCHLVHDLLIHLSEPKLGAWQGRRPTLLRRTRRVGTCSWSGCSRYGRCRTCRAGASGNTGPRDTPELTQLFIRLPPPVMGEGLLLSRHWRHRSKGVGLGLKFPELSRHFDRLAGGNRA